MSSAHFQTNNRSVLIVHSPVPSISLQQLGTSHFSLKKVRVASSLDRKYVFVWLLPGKSV